MPLSLSEFHHLRPQYEYPQSTILDWLAAAHTRAEALIQKTTKGENDFDASAFKESIRTRLYKLGHGAGKIKSRGAHLQDFGHTNWDKMELFGLNSLSEACIGKKTQLFSKAADQFFEDLYTTRILPEDLIHVTCTGYQFPSAGQKIVAKKKAGRSTIVTHVYHMGCYGAIAALHVARGFVGSSSKKKLILSTRNFVLFISTRKYIQPNN